MYVYTFGVIQSDAVIAISGCYYFHVFAVHCILTSYCIYITHSTLHSPHACHHHSCHHSLTTVSNFTNQQSPNSSVALTMHFSHTCHHYSCHHSLTTISNFTSQHSLNSSIALIKHLSHTCHHYSHHSLTTAHHPSPFSTHQTTLVLTSAPLTHLSSLLLSPLTHHYIVPFTSQQSLNRSAALTMHLSHLIPPHTRKFSLHLPLKSPLKLITHTHHTSF